MSKSPGLNHLSRWRFFCCNYILKSAYGKKSKIPVIVGEFCPGCEKMKPEEMLNYAAKFEFPPTKNLRLSIEKSVSLGGDHWLIKNMGTEVFDPIKGKFGFIRVDKSTPKYYYLSLKDAFELVKWIIRKEEGDNINYTGRCRQCGKFFGEDQLKEEYGWNWCQECYDDLQS